MFAELSCGGCDAAMQIDSEDDTGVWMLVWRFTEAHTAHGFVTPQRQPDGAIRDTPAKPRDTG